MVVLSWVPFSFKVYDSHHQSARAHTYIYIYIYMLSILASYQKYISFILNSHPNNNLINSRMYRIAVYCIYILKDCLSPCIWVMTTTNFGVWSSLFRPKKLNCYDPSWENLASCVWWTWNVCRSWCFWSALLFFSLVHHYLPWPTLWATKCFLSSANIIYKHQFLV